MSRILQGIADVFPRVQALGCHVHFSQPLSSASWNQKILLDMTQKTLKAVVNGCAWGLRDSQGSLLNQSWQILTTSPDVERILNHRPCDQRHKHGRLPDHFSAFSLQFPQSLCQKLAKQFLVKDCWNSALGILEQLHYDDDGPVGKARLAWTLYHQKWTLIAMLTCHQQSHLLLKQVRLRLREKKSPTVVTDNSSTDRTS